ncbi:NGCA protein, partial [Molothrus ater]|nr:NGCA protein [Molothrus ater]
ELPDSGRRSLRDGALILSRLEPNDSMVAQCEASNSHGRLLANAFVYVMGESPPKRPKNHKPPKALQDPPKICSMLSPALEPALQDDRAFAFTNGSLRLGPAARADSGLYTCRARNGHSNASVSARLDVRGEG